MQDQKLKEWMEQKSLGIHQSKNKICSKSVDYAYFKIKLLSLKQVRI